MEYLFDGINRLKTRLADKFVFLFLDYDGTISPIARIPDKAVISGKTRALLETLSLHPERRVAIISGRALEDIKDKIGLKHIIYAANHGLEIEGPKIRFRYHLAPGYMAIMWTIEKELKNKLRRFKGVLIENKTICLCLHYRLAKKKDIPLIKAIFKWDTLPYIVSGKVKIASGKKLMEVRPQVKWNKGSVVIWLLARQKVFNKRVTPVYIGDDVTDEDAFRALRKTGITVFVGKPGSSCAKYYLKNTGEVIEFLRLLAKV